VRIELLYFEGCPSYEALLPRLRALLRREGVDEEVEPRLVETTEAADRERFLGSPTVRVDGIDIDPGAAERDDFGLNCRIYRSAEGASGVPPEHWITDAVGRGQAGAGS